MKILEKGTLLLILISLVSITVGWHFLVKANVIPPLFDTKEVLRHEMEDGFIVGWKEIKRKGVLSLTKNWFSETFSSGSSENRESIKLIFPKDGFVKINDNLSLTYRGMSRGRIKLIDQNGGMHLILNQKGHKNPFNGIVLEVEETDENQIRAKIYPKNKSDNPLSPPGA